jgi:hypothetical protein
MPIIAVPSAPSAGLSTYLDLVRRLAIECGVTKDAATSIPTIVNATGETGRLAMWVMSAWRDIQALHKNWQFMRRSVSFTTVDGQAEYTPAQAGITALTFGHWNLYTFRNYNTAAGTASEICMDVWEYERWRDTFQLGAMRSAKSQPTIVTVTPAKSLGLGMIPLAGYTVVGDYYLAPVDLLSDTDVPTLPDWHNPMIIVYRAMLDYGFFESAPEVIQRAELKYKQLLQRLEFDQLQPVQWRAAL